MHPWFLTVFFFSSFVCSFVAVWQSPRNSIYFNNNVRVVSTYTHCTCTRPWILSLISFFGIWIRFRHHVSYSSHTHLIAHFSFVVTTLGGFWWGENERYTHTHTQECLHALIFWDDSIKRFVLQSNFWLLAFFISFSWMIMMKCINEKSKKIKKQFPMRNVRREKNAISFFRFSFCLATRVENFGFLWICKFHCFFLYFISIYCLWSALQLLILR